MEMIVQIPFQQLLTAVKTLSPTQKARLRIELAEEKNRVDDKAAYLAMLLNGPVFTGEEIQTIEETRKNIAQWRTKN